MVAEDAVEKIYALSFDPADNRSTLQIPGVIEHPIPNHNEHFSVPYITVIVDRE